MGRVREALTAVLVTDYDQFDRVYEVHSAVALHGGWDDELMSWLVLVEAEVELWLCPHIPGFRWPLGALPMLTDSSSTKIVCYTG